MHTQGSGCRRCVGTVTHTHPSHAHLLVCAHTRAPVPGVACVGNVWLGCQWCVNLLLPLPQFPHLVSRTEKTSLLDGCPLRSMG